MKVNEIMREDIFNGPNRQELSFWFKEHEGEQHKQEMTRALAVNIIKATTGKTNCTYSNIDYNSFNVQFDIDEKYISIKEQERLADKIAKILSFKGFNMNNYVCNHNFYMKKGFDHTLETNALIRLQPMQPMSLSQIHKKILKCDILDVSNIKNIKPEGVLGLLLIPCEKLFITNISWGAIIKKHLSTKDILDCQEELIAEGLKGYAKL